MALQRADDGTKRALGAAGALLVAGAAVLSGCTQQRAPAPPGRAAQVAPGMGFFLDRTDDEGLKLAYGRANSDDVWLMLQCRPGTRQLEVFDMRHPKARTGEMLILVSGNMQSALPIAVQPDASTSEGAVAQAHASPDLPALNNFRHSGTLQVKLDGRDYALTATPAEKVQIARFFRGCERK